MKFVIRNIPNAMAIFMAVIFIDSLFFKFTDHPKTQQIFGLLDQWGTSIGAPGLFGHTGLFSQYVIGSIEVLASTLLLVGIIPRFHHVQALGALAGVLVMLGAVNFHLFTPLGVDPNHDGGGLFMAACTNLVFGLALLFGLRRKEFVLAVTRFVHIFAPAPE
ncbi:MAG: DoxX family membrane protein [Alphaproteobacteria bacterium]|nr:DoxX family membrane protein [Alphaproteobacteria bacterium]